MLGPLRSADDGVHQVTIGLEPAGIGSVKATITVNNSQVSVQLGTDSDDAHAALRQSLPMLQQELSKDGQQASVLLSDTSQDNSSRSGESATQNPDTEDDAEVTTSSNVLTGPRTSHIDLHL